MNRKYELVNTPSGLRDLLETIRSEHLVGLDTETSSVEIFKKDFELVGISIGTQAGLGWYIPVGHKNFMNLEYQEPNISKLQAKIFLSNLFKQNKVVYHNSDFDRKVIAKTLGIPIAQTLGDDTILLAHLVNENESLGLKDLSQRYLKVFESSWSPSKPILEEEMHDLVIKQDKTLDPFWFSNTANYFTVNSNGAVKFKTVINYTHAIFSLFKKIKLLSFKGTPETNFALVPNTVAALYAADDAINTVQLWNHLMDNYISGDEQLLWLYNEIEKRVNDVMIRASYRGIKIDRDYLLDKQKVLQGRIKAIDELIADCFETMIPEDRKDEFDITTFSGSSKQLATLFFEIYKLPVQERTLSGAPAVNAKSIASLIKLEDQFKNKVPPEVFRFLKLRTQKQNLTKLLSTYVEGFMKVADSNDRIHASYKVYGTSSGRLSAVNPNLQNISRLTEEELTEKPWMQGIDVRAALVTDSDDYVLVCNDFISMELVVAAGMCGDAAMIDIVMGGKDMYIHTAKSAFNVGHDLSDKEFKKQYKWQRQLGKIATLAQLFMGSEFTLIRNFGFSKEHAQACVAGFAKAYPGWVKYTQDCLKELIEKGCLVYPEYGYIRRLDAVPAEKPDYRLKDTNPELYERKRKAYSSFMAAYRSCVNATIQGFSAFVVKHAIIRIQDEFDSLGIDAQVLGQVHDEIITIAHRSVAVQASEIMMKFMERDINGVALKSDREFKTNLSKANGIEINDLWSIQEKEAEAMGEL